MFLLITKLKVKATDKVKGKVKGKVNVNVHEFPSLNQGIKQSQEIMDLLIINFQVKAKIKVYEFLSLFEQRHQTESRYINQISAGNRCI